jgi:hypothetical protein
MIEHVTVRNLSPATQQSYICADAAPHHAEAKVAKTATSAERAQRLPQVLRLLILDHPNTGIRVSASGNSPAVEERRQRALNRLPTSPCYDCFWDELASSGVTYLVERAGPSGQLRGREGRGRIFLF